MASLRSGGLFGGGTRTATLMLVRMLGETHAAEIARALDRTRSRVKGAVDALEVEGVIVGTDVGGVRRLTINPRYVGYVELCALLDKLAMHDIELQRALGQLRRRPRRAGKPI